MGRQKRDAAPWPRTQKLVVMDGGPRTRAWYFVDWWEDQIAHALHAGESAFEGRTLGYVETEGYVDHPQYPEREGRVWRWNPGLAYDRQAAREAQQNRGGRA